MISARVLLVGIALAISIPSAFADSTSTTTCGRSIRGYTCTSSFRTTQPAAPVVLSKAERDLLDREAAERDAKWQALCKPQRVVGDDGIGRYVYAQKGCENGRSE